MRNDGIDFELDVLHWMRRQLGDGRYEHRQLQRGQVADRPYEVDIHAAIPKRFWPAVICLGFIVAGILAAFTPSEVGMILSPVVIIAAVIISSVIANSPTHVWAEAKDRGATIKRTDVLKLANAAADVRACGSANWHPDELWFVSRNGFDLDALNFAREHQVKCFVAGKRGFKRVD